MSSTQSVEEPGLPDAEVSAGAGQDSCSLPVAYLVSGVCGRLGSAGPLNQPPRDAHVSLLPNLKETLGTPSRSGSHNTATSSKEGSGRRRPEGETQRFRPWTRLAQGDHCSFKTAYCSSLLLSLKSEAGECRIAR